MERVDFTTDPDLRGTRSLVRTRLAAEDDYFSAPVLSPDGRSCCIEEIILRQVRD